MSRTAHPTRTIRPPRPLLRLRVSLAESEPEIWRLLEVDAGLSLAELHDVLQLAFGWRDSHLHNFADHEQYLPQNQLPRIGRKPRVWASDEPYVEPVDGQLSERDWTLTQVFDGFDGPLYYEYDFGDGWNHQIELVERIADAPDAPKALLLRGERRGPLDDSGGIGGYEEKLEILADPKHPEHDFIADWVHWVSGAWTPFDPELVEFDHINQELAIRFDGGLGMSGLPTDAFPGSSASASAGLTAAEAALAATPPLLDDAAIVDLLTRIPVSARIELRGLLRRSGALAPANIDSATAAAMVEPFLWFVRKAGADGIRLTQAGWLPPAVVSDAIRELGWKNRWIGMMNREERTPPIANLRADAVRFGLLRKSKGVLHATAAARKLLDDPGALLRMLAGAILRRARSDIERDITVLVALDLATGHTTQVPSGFGYESSSILYGLEVLGWGGPGGGPLTDEMISSSLHQMIRQLDPLDVFEQTVWRHGEATEHGRAFGRLMLRAPIE
ncbi:plasmid pRiA4b ORF-3 family protein [Rathayibacter soli]|uniref:plasmid pRiA4b ORF-3 family protein n=1 Tax=Rathayibacter soli TaxID=3144168 RepID=UPI0027E56766|nr:plasmid pRiA4b ORF-3 family protein [Glaciibacter superstes]